MANKEESYKDKEAIKIIHKIFQAEKKIYWFIYKWSKSMIDWSYWKNYHKRPTFMDKWAY